MKRLHALALLVIALLAFAALACGDDEDEDGGDASSGGLDKQNPFRIAVPADQSGFLSFYSGNNVNGAKAAVALINKQGGILGREVVLDIRDGASDAAKGAEVGKEMILSGKYNAMYVAIPFAAGNLAPEIQKAKMFAIATSGDSRLADPKFSPNTFELPASPVDQAAAIACFVKTQPYKSVAILATESAYGKAQVDTWNKDLPRLGIKVTGTEFPTTGTKDMTAQVTKLRGGNPEALILEGGGPDIAVMFEALKNLKWDVPIIGGNGLSTTNYEQILKSLDDIPKNSIMTSWSINVRKPGGISPNQKKAIDGLREQGVKIDQPLYIYAFGWDVMMLMKFAAETAKSDKPEEMIKALETLGAIKDQSKHGFILAEHYDFSKEFHGLKTVPFTTAKLGKFTDGLYEYGGKDFASTC